MQLGVKEKDAPDRIQQYWASVGHPELSGADELNDFLTLPAYARID